MLKYIVKPDDSLYAIALKYKTSINSIMTCNMIHNPYHIYPGQLIYIPLNQCIYPKKEINSKVSDNLPAEEKAELYAPPFCAKMILSGLLTLLSLSQRIYHTNDTVVFNLLKLNLSSHPIKLHYNTGQRYDFKIIYPSGHTLWLWSKNKSFIQALGSMTLDVGQSVLYSESFTLPTNLPPGLYKVSAWNTSQQTRNCKLYLPIYITNSNTTISSV